MLYYAKSSSEVVSTHWQLVLSQGPPQHFLLSNVLGDSMYHSLFLRAMRELKAPACIAIFIRTWLFYASDKYLALDHKSYSHAARGKL